MMNALSVQIQSQLILCVCVHMRVCVHMHVCEFGRVFHCIHVTGHEKCARKREMNNGRSSIIHIYSLQTYAYNDT